MPKAYRNNNKSELVLVKLILISLCVKTAQTCDNQVRDESVLDRELKNYVDRVLKFENFNVIPGVEIEKLENVTLMNNETMCDSKRSVQSFGEYFQNRLDQYAQTHVMSVNILETARFLSSNSDPPTAAATSTDPVGKSSFLAGFGMGFLAFFLKKLMLPVFIGAQIVKSVLIAMFLPTILGGIGKLAGKGLSTVSGLSGASTGINRPPVEEVEDFSFKDTDSYNNEEALGANFNDEHDSLTLNTVDSSSTASPNSRFDFAHNRVYSAPTINDNYYLRRPNKKTDYKVFHKIPSSSLLLTSYDPFYSPLLSRLDAIFKDLGLGSDKTPQTERCRERLVCMMYANPAKYAPYSNFVSAQLSRELNELRKPASDNSDILRFFRYMKAAKDGQDGEECLAHSGCPSLTANQPSPALLTTYNDINKLVLARKLNR